MGEELQHTDAREMARFEAMTIPEQLREIWLNGRETNGHVADAMRDIAEIKEWRTVELKPWMAKIDRWVIGAAAILMFILILAPFVFKLLDAVGK